MLQSGLCCEHIVPLSSCEAYTCAGLDAAPRSMQDVDFAATAALYAADDSSPPPPPLFHHLQFNYTPVALPPSLHEHLRGLPPVPR